MRVAVAALAASLLSPAAHAGDRTCGWPQALPSAETCAGELQAAAAAEASATSVPAAPNSSLSALLARADARRHADALPEAERALLCAAAQPGAADDMRQRYEVVRRFGLVEYARARPVEALARFECALTLARELDDRIEVARQLKNVGSSLRRIGDYSGAMRALVDSLELQRAAGDAAVGPVLNNIADVYREMEQYDDAERYYREALAAFRAAGDVVQSMHVYISLAYLSQDRRDGDGGDATALLQQALDDLRGAADGDAATGALRYQLLIRAGLIHAALAAGDTAAARAHLSDALAFADAHRLDLPSQLQLEAARTERLSGRGEAAVMRLRAAVAATDGAPAQQAPLLRELSLALQDAGREAEALDALRMAFARETEDLRAQRDRGLAWSNARFNLNESRRQLAEAEAQAQRRTLQLWLSMISALAALALLALVFQRRHQRAREAEAVRRARYEQALTHYRREYAALAEDRHLLQALLDSRSDALVLTDGDGVVLAANRAACERLAAEPEAIVGSALADTFDAESATALREALERMEDIGGLRLYLQSAEPGVRLQADLQPWEGGDGKIVLGLQPAGPGDVVSSGAIAADAADDSGRVAGSGASPADATTPDAKTPEVGIDTVSADAGEGDDARRDAFRRGLVELMLAVVEAWERSTGHNRIELAERSRIWRVNIDDGRLRARAMERYLSLSKLPRNPRWRDVLRSAYYVLSHCEALPAQTREDLQQRVDALLEHGRRQAMG